jgi:hypothetical protein
MHSQLIYNMFDALDFAKSQDRARERYYAFTM